MLPAPVFAHGLVGRADLPIPEALFAGAAALVLVLSFAALAAAVADAAAAGAARAAAGAAAASRSTSCSASSAWRRSRVVVYAGLAGTDAEQDNLAPTPSS